MCTLAGARDAVALKVIGTVGPGSRSFKGEEYYYVA